MAALYIVSAERAAGKTAIGAGLGKRLLGDGKKVGFLKPIIDGANPPAADGDAAFMKQVLGLPEAADSLSSVVDKIKEAYARVSQDKDVVIIEGMVGASPDDNLSKAAYEVARALGARVIAVEGYSNQPSCFTASYKGFGGNLLGVIVNKVPKSQLKRTSGEASAQFGGAGISVLGVIPEDRILLALTVAELAGSIQGKIISSAGKSKELVENLMLGAMVVDSGLEYFGRKVNKAAVVRGDRPDMQLAALETPTKCLVISGSTAQPIHSVLYRAENKEVPIILTESGTESIVAAIEGALDRGRFSEEGKLPKLAEIMKQHLDYKAIYKGLSAAG